MEKAETCSSRMCVDFFCVYLWLGNPTTHYQSTIVLITYGPEGIVLIGSIGDYSVQLRTVIWLHWKFDRLSAVFAGGALNRGSGGGR